VLSANLHRRHLNASQRAMVAAKLGTFTHGGDRSKAPIGGLTDAAAAKVLSVGERSVERARQVLAKGDPSLAEAVEQGKLSVTAAAAAAAGAIPAAAADTASGNTTTTTKMPSEKITDKIKTLVKDLKAYKEKNKDDAIDLVQGLVDQLRAADLIEEKRGKKAA
jgi:hypothetical protein